MAEKIADRAHYRSGEPGSTGREPFEEGDSNSGRTGSGLATDSHGGTIARDTQVREGQVVGLAGPTDGGHGLGGTGTGAGLGAGAGAGAVGAGLAGAGSHHHHSSDQGRGQNFGEEHSSVTHGDRREHEHDRTGALDQEAHKYESTGARGPTTSGAAGTDRFDVSSSESGLTKNKDNYGSSDVRSPPDVVHDDSHRKGTGGIGGILGTSDKDFTANPSRTGDGAYHDSDGLFKTNTTGPSGHSALTGREGTTEHNPVAQHKSRQEGDRVGTDAGAGHDGEKPGLVEKIKHAFS